MRSNEHFCKSEKVVISQQVNQKSQNQLVPQAENAFPDDAIIYGVKKEIGRAHV
jgi:hypothetical protein